MDLKEQTRVAISDFKAHCTEHLRRVERTGVPMQVTRHGKVVAVVNPPQKESPTLAEWMGSGAGTVVKGSGDLFH
jgi:prevent-host-death family protein